MTGSEQPQWTWTYCSMNRYAYPGVVRSWVPLLFLTHDAAQVGRIRGTCTAPTNVSFPMERLPLDPLLVLSLLRSREQVQFLNETRVDFSNYAMCQTTPFSESASHVMQKTKP